MEKVFESLIESVPIIKELFEEDTSVSIEDDEKILFVSHGNSMNLPVEVGDRLKEDYVSNILKKEKKTIHVVLNKEEHGVDIRIVKVPIINDKGKIIGAFSLNRNNEKESLIRNTSGNLMDSLQETSNVVNKIANSAMELSNNLNILIEKTKITENSIKDSSKAVKLIQDISKQINMLGLNAAIESSRAGEFGRGFSVVASEMRKLSIQSGESSKEISSSLLDMQKNIESILKSIHELGQIANEQAESTKEVSATIDEISTNSKALVESVKVQ